MTLQKKSDRKRDYIVHYRRLNDSKNNIIVISI